MTLYFAAPWQAAATVGKGHWHAVDYCRERGKRLLAAAMGILYYGWRMNDPSGTAPPDATRTPHPRGHCGLTVLAAS